MICIMFETYLGQVKGDNAWVSKQPKRVCFIYLTLIVDKEKVLRNKLLFFPALENIITAVSHKKVIEIAALNGMKIN